MVAFVPNSQPCRRRDGGQKRRYPSSTEAKKALKEMQARKGGRAMQPYHCGECGSWHIGHRPKVWR